MSNKNLISECQKFELKNSSYFFSMLKIKVFEFYRETEKQILIKRINLVNYILIGFS